MRHHCEHFQFCSKDAFVGERKAEEIDKMNGRNMEYRERLSTKVQVLEPIGVELRANLKCL